MLAAVAALWLQTQTALPTQFDLLCEGKAWSSATSRGSPIFGRDGSSWPMHLRIDLDGRRWCEGRCEGAPRLLLKADAYALTLEKGQDGDDHAYFSVDRTTGDVFEDTLTDGVHTTFSGKCIAAAFSGFPEPHPKF